MTVFVGPTVDTICIQYVVYSQCDGPKPQLPVALSARHRGELEPGDGGRVVGGAGHPVALGQPGAAGGDHGLAADGTGGQHLGLMLLLLI